MTLSKQLREADRKLTALENDVKAVRLIQRMNRDEQEKLAMKLLLLKAQMILSRHGEFQVADEIGDFLSTPFASTEGEQVSTTYHTSRGGSSNGLHVTQGSAPESDRHVAIPELSRMERRNGCVAQMDMPRTDAVTGDGLSTSPDKFNFASTPDEAQGHTSRVVAGETDGCGELPLGANAAGLMPSGVSTKTPLLRNEQPSEIFPRAHPSNAGGPGLGESRPIPKIHLCNKERRSIVRSAEERGK